MKVRLIVLVLLLSLLLATCKHEIFKPGDNITGDNNGGTSPDSIVSCDPDSVYFVNIVLPIMSSNCAMSGCHNTTSHQEGLVLINYTGILKIVQPGNALKSKLYQVITAAGEDIMPPRPHSPLSSANVASIKIWINQGAKNNQCLGDCDTSVFTYSGAVAPIMNSYCKGCHNPNALNGGIDLSTYSGVQAVALNGKLRGTITHSAGYSPMPQGGNQLPSCEIIQIEKWIQAGANNN